jgi:hypothetical protein
MDSLEQSDALTADAKQRSAGSGRLRQRASHTRELIRIAYRDPEHVAERLSQFAAQKLAEPSRKWAIAARRAHPSATPAELAQELRAKSARSARIDGAVSGTPFLVATVPGYISYLWQETRMALGIAALYGRDPGSLQTSAEVLVLRGVHDSVDAAESAVLAIVDKPLPPRVQKRRPLKTWYRAVRQVLILGGFLSAKSEPREDISHPRLRAAAGLIFGAALWAVTFILPLTFMIMMAWGCESHARKLGQHTIAFYGGEDAKIASRARVRDRGYDLRQIVRAGALFLSVAIPIAFVAYAYHEREVLGAGWLPWLGALVGLSLVLAISVVGSRQLRYDVGSDEEE